MNINFNEIDLANIPDLPMQIKVVIIGIAVIFILALGYYLDTRNQLLRLKSGAAAQKELKMTFELKQQQAINLKPYRQQLQTIKEEFAKLIEKLPSFAEVPDLLDEISKMGASSGLSFKLFKPMPEVVKEFYVEMPIQMAVVGTYNQIADFISQLANLDRIISLHDFTLERYTNTASADKNDQVANPDMNNQLILNLTAKTYYYKENTNS